MKIEIDIALNKDEYFTLEDLNYYKTKKQKDPKYVEN